MTNELEVVFNEYRERWTTELDESVDDVESLADEFTGLEDRLAQLEDKCADLDDAMKSRLEEWNESMETWVERFETVFELVQEQFEQVHEISTQAVADEWAGICQFSEEWSAELQALFRQNLENAVQDELLETESHLSEVVQDNLDSLQDVDEQFRAAVKHAFADLRQYAGEQATRVIEAEVRKIGEAAIDRVKQEVLDGIVESQLQVQITSTLSSMLPQLIAAKTLAPAIRRALDVMRAGF